MDPDVPPLRNARVRRHLSASVAVIDDAEFEAAIAAAESLRRSTATPTSVDAFARCSQDSMTAAHCGDREVGRRCRTARQTPVS